MNTARDDVEFKMCAVERGGRSPGLSTLLHGFSLPQEVSLRSSAAAGRIIVHRVCAYCARGRALAENCRLAIIDCHVVYGKVLSQPTDTQLSAFFGHKFSSIVAKCARIIYLYSENHLTEYCADAPSPLSAPSWAFCIHACFASVRRKFSL